MSGGRGFGVRFSAFLLGAVVTLSGVAACASEDDGADVESGRPADFEASPEFLAAAITDSKGEPHRYQGTMTMGMDDELLVEDAPVLTGASDGERSWDEMDISAIAKSAAVENPWGDRPDIDPDDQKIEIFQSETTYYLRAPFLAAVGEELDPPEREPTKAMYELLGPLGDKWGTVDLAYLRDNATATTASRLQNFGGRSDPGMYLDLVAGADEVDELGDEEIDGDPVVGLAAQVSMIDMIEAQGGDLEELARSQGAGPEDQAEVEAAIDKLEELRFGVDVWLDGDGHVRRVTVDVGKMQTKMAELRGMHPPELVLKVTIDFFDYGDESISVEVPAESETADITQAFIDYYE